MSDRLDVAFAVALADVELQLLGTANRCISASSRINNDEGGQDEIGQPQIPWDYVARKSAQMFNTTATLGYPVSLAQDNAGNLYLLDLYGAIYSFTFNADVEFQSRFE